MGWILDRPWINFWWILGSSWGPSWIQAGTVRKMMFPRGSQKTIENQEAQQISSNQEYPRVTLGGGEGPYIPLEQRER